MLIQLREFFSKIHNLKIYINVQNITTKNNNFKLNFAKNSSILQLTMKFRYFFYYYLLHCTIFKKIIYPNIIKVNIKEIIYSVHITITL